MMKDDSETSGNLQKAVLSNTQLDLILTSTKTNFGVIDRKRGVQLLF